MQQGMERIAFVTMLVSLSIFVVGVHTAYFSEQDVTMRC